MGILYNLKGAQFTDSRLPQLRAYPGLTDGSLALLDASQLGNIDFTSVVTGIPNLAVSEATRLTGKTEADLAFTWSNTLGLTGPPLRLSLKERQRAGCMVFFPRRTKSQVTGVDSKLRASWSMLLHTKMTINLHSSCTIV